MKINAGATTRKMTIGRFLLCNQQEAKNDSKYNPKKIRLPVITICNTKSKKINAENLQWNFRSFTCSSANNTAVAVKRICAASDNCVNSTYQSPILPTSSSWRLNQWETRNTSRPPTI